MLSPTLFGIYFAVMLRQAFSFPQKEFVSALDGKLFNLSKRKQKQVRDMLFAEHAAIVAHSKHPLQSLVDCFSNACENFGLTISL